MTIAFTLPALAGLIVLCLAIGYGCGWFDRDKSKYDNGDDER